MNYLKLIYRIVVPLSIRNYYRKLKAEKKIIKSYYYDYKKYFKFSSSYSLAADTSSKLLGNIIKNYHVIEKGLTMPDMRLGFGEDRILILCRYCDKFATMYGASDSQLLHALGVLSEYKKLHDKEKYSLRPETTAAIDSLIALYNIPSSSQIDITKKDYFKELSSDFLLFSNSRFSVRNYTEEEIPIEQILKAIKLSCNTPSACNRQAWRTYVYLDKKKINEILEIQGGNRGFGHLGNKLIVISAELGMFAGDLERNQAFIDGGMYAMNLLYSLHYNKIACCILNSSHSKEKDLNIRKVCNIKESEVFIAMVICGIPPLQFRIPSSQRYDISDTNTIVE